MLYMFLLLFLSGISNVEITEVLSSYKYQ